MPPNRACADRVDRFYLLILIEQIVEAADIFEQLGIKPQAFRLIGQGWRRRIFFGLVDPRPPHHCLGSLTSGTGLQRIDNTFQHTGDHRLAAAHAGRRSARRPWTRRSSCAPASTPGRQWARHRCRSASRKSFSIPARSRRWRAEKPPPCLPSWQVEGLIPIGLPSRFRSLRAYSEWHRYYGAQHADQFEGGF